VCELFDNHAFLEIRYEVADGQQAVEEAKKHRPDLVILDLSMPVMDGLEAAKTIHNLFPEIPIILLTLYADIIQTSDTAGFTRIIPKSKMQALVSQAEELIRPV
jgi:CheY-like chemotaxis protein